MRIAAVLIIGVLSICSIASAYADQKRDIEVLRKARERLGRSASTSLFQLNGFEVFDFGIDIEGHQTIDLEQRVCEEAQDLSTPAVLEKFEDALLKFKIRNLLAVSVRMKKFWFQIPYPEGMLAGVRSSKINFTGNQLIAARSDSELLAIMLEVSSGNKILPGHGILLQEGFRNVKFFLRARAKDGKSLFRRIKSTISFRFEDRCQPSA